MKKVTLAALLLSVSSFAAAENGTFGGIKYSYYDGVGDSSGIDANAYSVQLGAKIIDGLVVDGITEFKEFDDVNVNQNRLEIGLTPSTKVYDDFGIYGRLALGQNWLSGIGTEDFSYGSIEPGMFYDFGQGNVNLGYRYRDSFDDKYLYQTNSVVFGGEYKIDSVNSIVGNYQYMSGDEEFSVFSVGYRANF